jgi:membrane protein DedA with SNARE-associated domain
VAGWLDALLERMLQIPEALLLLVLVLAAALENLVPPIPADVIVAFGGFLAGMRESSAWLVFLLVWPANVAGATVVYVVGRRYGPGFFAGRLGHMLLKPRQLAALASFYRRFGFTVIFLGRFLPMFRAVVPAFAGITGLGAVRTMVPLALASGAWYGALIYLGATAGQNWDTISAVLDGWGRWLTLFAVVVALAALLLWWRSRSDPTAG